MINSHRNLFTVASLVLALGFFSKPVRAQLSLSDLATLTPGRTKAINALWGENPLAVQFKTTNRVVVAEIKGPAEITMIHFAYPNRRSPGTLSLNRDVRLCIYWDGESSPSVDCPLVDFFCDPNGERDVVNTALVNVRQGFNCYFPMPFRKSARIELVYDGLLPAGRKLQLAMPCYSYVCYRTLKKMPADAGYFCTSWRQEEILLGKKDYLALEAKGKGKFVGWNITIRSLYSQKRPVVDENEKFYIDGETNASIEFQGLEDSFGFSWGFPPTENMFPLTGWFPFHTNGAAAYRFFVPDAISFEKSLKVAIGFGATENGWRQNFSSPSTRLQMSSTVYWYQEDPPAPFPPLPPVEERSPVAISVFSNRWEQAVQTYEVADRTNPPPLDAILFTGASNIRLWKNLPQAFPAHKVFNRGFGGAEMSDLVKFAGRIVIPYRPKIVIIYAGDNDLADDKTPEQILSDFKTFTQKVHAALPDTVIGCIAVKPSPSRAQLVPQVKATDALLESFCRTNANTIYIDDLTPMLSATDRPRPELFGKDRLHLNAQGRALWTSLIQPVLDRYDPPRTKTSP